VLVKYNSSGTAQWARTVSILSLSSSCPFSSVTVDASGNVYAAGYQNQSAPVTYDIGVTAQGGSAYDRNVVLVKYNSTGTAEWARTVSTGERSEFNSVAVDTYGNVYAAGYQGGTSTYTYGSGVTAQGSHAEVYGDAMYGGNSVLVKYKKP